MVSFDVSVERLERARAFVGLEVRVTEEALFQEAPGLARACAAVKEDLPHRVMPVETAVVTGTAGEDGAFSYFMGDEVEPGGAKVREALASAEGLVLRELPAGTLVARVPVRFSLQAGVAMKAARIRAYIHGEWLAENGYRIAQGLGIQDIELYHYRRRRFRQARKMVMELAFPIEKV